MSADPSHPPSLSPLLAATMETLSVCPLHHCPCRYEVCETVVFGRGCLAAAPPPVDLDRCHRARPQDRRAAPLVRHAAREHHAQVRLPIGRLVRAGGRGRGAEAPPPPQLTWYLNGQRQQQPFPERGRLLMTSPMTSSSSPPRERINSSYWLLARKWDRELVCTVANPSTGESANATVTLNVQFEPEIVRVNAHYSDGGEQQQQGGVSLVVFALVRSNPPAVVTFVDQSGRAVANASSSHFLVLDSAHHSYPSPVSSSSSSPPQLANHTLRLALTSLSGWGGNVTLNASNSLGAAQSNLTLTEFLSSSVEVPMLGIVTGGGMAFMALLVLSLIVLCLMQKTKAVDEPVEILLMTKKSESSNPKPEKATKAKLPRDNMSLPSNMQLNDLNALRRAREAALQQQQCMLGERRKRREDVDDEDLTAAYAARGFSRYPMVGYIYKVSSTSSEEIWL